MWRHTDKNNKTWWFGPWLQYAQLDLSTSNVANDRSFRETKGLLGTDSGYAPLYPDALPALFPYRKDRALTWGNLRTALSRYTFPGPLDAWFAYTGVEDEPSDEVRINGVTFFYFLVVGILNSGHLSSDKYGSSWTSRPKVLTSLKVRLVTDTTSEQDKSKRKPHVDVNVLDDLTKRPKLGMAYIQTFLTDEVNNKYPNIEANSPVEFATRVHIIAARRLCFPESEDLTQKTSRLTRISPSTLDIDVKKKVVDVENRRKRLKVTDGAGVEYAAALSWAQNSKEETIPRVDMDALDKLEEMFGSTDINHTYP
jgi:hypothetical protein